MAEFDCLRNVVLQTVPVLQEFRVCYSNDADSQSEWVLADLLKILETNRYDKRLEASKKWLEEGENCTGTSGQTGNFPKEG